MTTPSSMRSTAPGDKYSPPGGYNLPQSSIDRPKVSEPGTGEVKAGGTAIARRSLAKPARGQSTVDTQLTAGRVTGAGAAAAAAGGVATAAGADETTPADSLAISAINHEALERDAAASMEAADHKPSEGAAVAFADTPEATEGEASAEETRRGQPDGRVSLASTGGWSSGTPTEQNLIAQTSTLRILSADDRDSGVSTTDDPKLAVQTGADDAAGNDEAGEPSREEYAQNTRGTSPAPEMQEDGPGRASLIPTTEPAEQTATLAMAESTSNVLATSWNEAASATSTAAPANGAPRANGPAARASQPYAYDPSYGWLRGRLEYSASQRQWKLRYIPIDGATDQFGGSVVLADGAATQGLRAGDFVTAQGRVVGASAPGRGFSPRYEVASIQPAVGSN